MIQGIYSLVKGYWALWVAAQRASGLWGVGHRGLMLRVLGFWGHLNSLKHDFKAFGVLGRRVLMLGV